MRLISVVPGLLLVGGFAGIMSGAETAPPTAVETPAVAEAISRSDATAGSKATIAIANRLAVDGKFPEALAVLDSWLKDNPSDLIARQHLLALKVSQKEADIRAVLSEQSDNKGLILADPDYEAARNRADADVQRRLAVVEYFLSQNRLTDAAQGCNAILRDHPHDDATMRLKYRILNIIVEKERKELLKDQEAKRGQALNDVIEDNSFARDKPRVQRQVFIFQEDLDEVERAKVKAKLQERITLNQDQAKVWDVMKTLFALSGINYVVLDSAIGDETVSLHLVDDTVESVLNSVGKLAKVRFSYTDGTVFVSSDADDGLVSEIIHLRSGLTNVDAEVNASSFSSGGSGGSSGSGGGGQNGANGGMGQNGNLPQGNNRNGAGTNGRNGPGTGGAANGQGGANGQAGAAGKSDLEKFLEKLPDIITGWQDTHKWFLDRKSNTLYLRASPWVISETKRLLHAMDYNNAQVLIESRFVEVSEDALRQLGVDWGAFQGGNPANPNWAGGNGAPVAPSSIAGGTNPVTGTINSTTVGPGTILSGLLQQNGFTLNASLKALESNGKADSLAEPKILTLNNATGIIEIVKNYTFIETYNVQTYSDSQTISNGNVQTNSRAVATPQWQSEDLGYQLKITPSIARNSDVITLHLLPTVRELIDENKIPNGFEYVDQGKTITKEVSKPRFAKRSLETILHVQNGQTLALGGLADEQDSQRTTGTPFISKIPVLGWLFKNETRQSQRRNLIILVTATIVDPSGSKVGDDLEHLRDTAKILIPDPVKGLEPAKPVMAEAAHPAGPNPAPEASDAANPNRDTQKGRRR